MDLPLVLLHDWWVLMKAILLTRAGSADRLAVSEVAKPIQGPGEVLVKIHATSVTRGDVVLRKMPKLITRLVGEMPKSILGHEFAGQIEAIGEGVKSFSTGDRIFGTTTGLRQGSYAEYITMPADGVISTIPSNISYEEAAPTPVGAMAALHFLRQGGVEADKRVLINGASGSVGTFAVQIAKHLGANVTGVSGTSNIELVESLGADEVIDYKKTDFTESSATYDVIFDAVGKTSAKKVRGVLADSGVFVTTQERRDETIDELAEVRHLLEAGALKPVIDRSYTLDQISEAHRYVEQGHKRGNVLVVIVES